MDQGRLFVARYNHWCWWGPPVSLLELCNVRKGGGKIKGAEFEREICKALSLWLSNGAAEDVLWRSAMSGGRATVARLKGKRLATQAGDISCINPIGHRFAAEFMIECKFYKDLQWHGLLANKGKLLEFWKVAKEEATRYSKQPLLIAKQNKMPIYACMTKKGTKMLGLETKCSMILPLTNLYVVLFDDFVRYAARLTGDYNAIQDTTSL